LCKKNKIVEGREKRKKEKKKEKRGDLPFRPT
jgi:hypothetical protein